ncbi:MAG: hypothetical protein K0R55_925 [Sporomusa sp.]|nr:hypothetical protein [Sporomusa sp.]
MWILYIWDLKDMKMKSLPVLWKLEVIFFVRENE